MRSETLGSTARMMCVRRSLSTSSASARRASHRVGSRTSEEVCGLSMPFFEPVQAVPSSSHLLSPSPSSSAPSSSVLSDFIEMDDFDMEMQFIFNEQSHMPIAYEMAVPKRKTSVQRRKVRRQGQRAMKAKKMYKAYGICKACGNPVLLHHVCLTCMRPPML
jgi:ribosomal protein L32